MGLFRIAMASCATFVLLGCAQYRWQREGVTQGEFNRDSYSCQMEAARVFPAAPVRRELASGYTTQSTTNCTNGGLGGMSSISCTTTPGTYVPAIAYDEDANENRRAQAAKSCMYARGYKLVRVK